MNHILKVPTWCRCEMTSGTWPWQCVPMTMALKVAEWVAKCMWVAAGIARRWDGFTLDLHRQWRRGGWWCAAGHS